ncbi:MAG: GH32 C-terminal domain-containing protein [Verrucomicrobiales bacterium]
MNRRPLSAALLGLLLLVIRSPGEVKVLEDFEGSTYGEWKLEGDAFGTAPAKGPLPGQMNVEGFQGNGLASSFVGGDNSRGWLSSPPFKIERDWISFLIGGGGFAGKTCLNLLVDGKVVRTATGPNIEPGGSERLEPDAWQVADLRGQTAALAIVDEATGGWGHINVDHIVFTDAKPSGIAGPAERSIPANERWLHFPVKNGARKKTVTVSAEGRIERAFEIELADAGPDWWAPLDITRWRGQEIAIKVDKLSEGSRALELLEQADAVKGSETLYREPLRPGLHFSAQRGWINDPNGLVYHRGTYHLFFQHNPYGWNWGNMHWGHATSRDLMYWQQRAEALYPDALGTMFSGSAVVDWKNTSGFQCGEESPLVLIYTAAGGTGPQSRGQPFTQCLAFSNDAGRSWTKYEGNPVLKEITGGNRDPKVFWHEPTQRWVMVLYVEKGKAHTIAFLTSPNLRDWTMRSETAGFFECPDLFELPIDGDSSRTKWVLIAASSEYMTGSFDGTRFTPESPKLPGHRGKGFYAAQTFSDMPDGRRVPPGLTDPPEGRRVQIGWLQAPSPGMPFNQCLSLPLELSLHSTPEGPRLAWNATGTGALPVEEPHQNDFRLTVTEPTRVLKGKGELLEVHGFLETFGATKIELRIRGVPVAYHTKSQELIVNGHRVATPLDKGRLDFRIYADRTAFEVFASGGLVYIPMPVIPKPDQLGVEASVEGGEANFSVTVQELESIWERR